MPLVPFETLPDSARVWVFGSDRPLSDEATANLMTAVEGYLAEWKAHGEPLTAAYEWRFGRLLVDRASTSAPPAPPAARSTACSACCRGSSRS